MLCQLFAKPSKKREKNLSLRSGQRAMQCLGMSTEKRYSHLNEMREDFEIIGYVPK